MAGYSSWGCKELDMTEWVTFSLYPASKLSPNSSFFPLLPILSLESFHLWVKKSTSSYLFIFIDIISRDPKYIFTLYMYDPGHICCPTYSQFRGEERFPQSFLRLWSVFFSQGDLINSLCCTLTLMALATFHTSWRIWSLHSFNASEHIHSTNNTNN